jgi:energy-coupling factor transporter ATP-binding protein EcfA2
MKLVRISVDKYRSIDRAAEFDVSEYTVLVGANNQGKSNLLRALNLGMEVMKAWPKPHGSRHWGTEIPVEALGPGFVANRFLGSRRFGDRSLIYDWEEDFPIFARSRKSGPKSTRIRLDFRLNEQEIWDFKQATGSSTNDKLPIEISIGKNACSISIKKQRSSILKDKAAEIARFVSERVRVLYIPAVRGPETSVNIASEILSSRRRISRSSEKYEEHLKALEVIDDSVNEEVGELLQSALVKFVPSVSRVSIETRPVRQSLRIEDIVIDDGDATSFLRKGDGIQSLVALALTMEWMQSRNGPDVDLIVAVEDPEAHLHPRAVHELRHVLARISESQQIIVTTHNQVFIDRRRIHNNVLVADRTAHPARNLDSLREALGITAQDGLSADVTVVVEGSSDVALISRLLDRMSSECRAAVVGGKLLITAAGRCSLIGSLVRAAELSLSVPVAVLDGDSAGKSEERRLLDNELISADRIAVVARKGSTCSELEDIVKPSVYQEELEKFLGFPLTNEQSGKLFKDKSRAWTERLSGILFDCGVAGVEERVKEGKRVVTCSACRTLDAGGDVLADDSKDFMVRLVHLVEQCLQ